MIFLKNIYALSYRGSLWTTYLMLHNCWSNHLKIKKGCGLKNGKGKACSQKKQQNNLV